MKRGFTLLEILVSLAIIGVLLSILYASFDSSRGSARDAQRKTDLKQLQLAIELYRSQNGRYPEQGCGGGTFWTGLGAHTDVTINSISCENWIEGLVPEYIDELPQDPRFELDSNRGYLYHTDSGGTVYKILAYGVVESSQIRSYEDDFARCPRGCGNAWCPNAGPVPDTYGLYSLGRECQ